MLLCVVKLVGVGTLIDQRLRKLLRESVHAWCRYPMCLIAQRLWRGNSPVFVKDVNALVPSSFARGNRRQNVRKARVALSKVLRAVVESAERAITSRHTAAKPSALFKDVDAVASLAKGARASEARQPCPDDG